MSSSARFFQMLPLQWQRIETAFIPPIRLVHSSNYQGVKDE
jgi:hypothetical protein